MHAPSTTTNTATASTRGPMPPHLLPSAAKKRPSLTARKPRSSGFSRTAVRPSTELRSKSKPQHETITTSGSAAATSSQVTLLDLLRPHGGRGPSRVPLRAASEHDVSS